MAGLAGLAVDLGHAAEEVEGDRVDAVAEALRDDGVRRLVEQHREVEHHREDEPGDVLPEAQAGLHLPRCAGANVREISRATMNHELVIRTSMPAIEPIRSVPGGPRRRRLAPLAGGWIVGVGHATSLANDSDTTPARRGLSYASPIVSRLMSIPVAPPACRVPRRAGLDAGRRRRRAGRDLAEPGGRLHGLPADVPLPHDRPAARGAVARRAARHPGPQGARGPLRPPGPRPHARAGRRHARADVAGAARGRARARRDVRRGRSGLRRLADVGPHGPRPLLRPRGPAAPRAGRPRALRRGAPRLQAAAARLRRPDRRGAGRPDQVGGLQVRQEPGRGLRGQGALPDAVLRARHLAAARRSCRRCSS